MGALDSRQPDSVADKKLLPKMVKEQYLKISLTKLYDVTENSVEILQWSENKGSAAEDGYTTELVAVKGLANIKDKMQDFSFMIKLTPEIGHRVNMVKENLMENQEYDMEKIKEMVPEQLTNAMNVTKLKSDQSNSKTKYGQYLIGLVKEAIGKNFI